MPLAHLLKELIDLQIAPLLYVYRKERDLWTNWAIEELQKNHVLIIKILYINYKKISQRIFGTQRFNIKIENKENGISVYSSLNGITDKDKKYKEMDIDKVLMHLKNFTDIKKYKKYVISIRSIIKNKYSSPWIIYYNPFYSLDWLEKKIFWNDPKQCDKYVTKNDCIRRIRQLSSALKENDYVLQIKLDEYLQTYEPNIYILKKNYNISSNLLEEYCKILNDEEFLQETEFCGISEKGRAPQPKISKTKASSVSKISPKRKSPTKTLTQQSIVLDKRLICIPIDNMTVVELKRYSKMLNIKNYSKMRKEQLINTLLDYAKINA